MKLIKTNIEGAYILLDEYKEDLRGGFNKLYNQDDFILNNINFELKEVYFNISKKNVIRGMHFQIPPFDHSKLIKCISGQILDVIIDIRKESPTYLNYDSYVLEGNDGKSIYLPKGIAHGFLSLLNNSIVLYNVSSVYSQKHDKGILWNSFGFDWQCQNPIISQRDLSFEKINEFNSPF